MSEKDALLRRIATLENLAEDCAKLIELRTGCRPTYIFRVLLGIDANFDATEEQTTYEYRAERRKEWLDRLMR